MSADTSVKLDRICPHCGRSNDGHTNTNSYDKQTVPRPGDISVCICCGGISVFMEDGMRKATLDERMAVLEQNPGLAAVLSMLAR